MSNTCNCISDGRIVLGIGFAVSVELVGSCPVLLRLDVGVISALSFGGLFALEFWSNLCMYAVRV